MSFTALTSLSPLDGRYAAKVDALRPQFSEYGLIRRRLQVEIEWLKALAAEAHFTEIPAFSPATLAALDRLLADFGALAVRFGHQLVVRRDAVDIFDDHPRVEKHCRIVKNQDRNLAERVDAGNLGFGCPGRVDLEFVIDFLLGQNDAHFARVRARQ